MYCLIIHTDNTEVKEVRKKMQSRNIELMKALRDRKLHMGDPINRNAAYMNIDQIFKAKGDQEDPTKYPAW